jgi:3-phosphoshikimate 1-carboxyvinyltransferase
MPYPDKLEIIPLNKPPTATIRVPGSKSITNRALVLAALTARDHPCELIGVLRSDDTEVMIEALRRLGFQVRPDWQANPQRVTLLENVGWIVPANTADLFVANSGTSMRFLTALVSLGRGRYRLDGVPRMRERPIEDLLSALRQFGVNARSELGNNCPPVVVETSGCLRCDHVVIKGNVSSQFVSALLMIAPYAESSVMIALDGPTVSEPYLEMTVAMMHQWGFIVRKKSSSYFVENVGDFYEREGFRPERVVYQIEPDASAASYFFGAGAITGGTLTVPDLPRNSLQGDVRFVGLLSQMGCEVQRDDNAITVTGRPLHGIDADMNDISDTVMTLAAVACFAQGPTTIRNVAHIRHKETDRLAALATELRKVGADVVEFHDGLTITPRPLHGAEIETYNDHRMAMSMALIGLKVPGIVIKNPGCVAKTYPGFWQDLDKLRA